MTVWNSIFDNFCKNIKLKRYLWCKGEERSYTYTVFWILSIETNLFTAMKQTIKSCRVYTSPTTYASSALYVLMFARDFIDKTIKGRKHHANRCFADWRSSTSDVAHYTLLAMSSMITDFSARDFQCHAQ